jgi:putative tryptophan/tyrosine transport system substrate-binding protein
VKRRKFITLLGGAAAAWLHATDSQSSKVHRIALVFTDSPVAVMAGPEPVHPAARTFLHTLRALDYVEGQNLILERRSAEGRYERYREIFADLVRLNVDVIVTYSTEMAQEAKAVTSTVPIVAVGAANPVESGLVNSLARPGGNITGLTYFVGPEMEAKRLQLLKDTLPGVIRVGYLSTIEDWEAPEAKNVRAAAQMLGLTIVLAAHTPTEYGDAFALLDGGGIDALFCNAGGYQFANRKLIVDFARKTRLPDIHSFREAVQVGALMSYGVSLTDLYRRAATYVDKILKAAKPADLPVEQPIKFDLVINLKTAKALGIKISDNVLSIADEIIE